MSIGYLITAQGNRALTNICKCIYIIRCISLNYSIFHTHHTHCRPLKPGESIVLNHNIIVSFSIWKIRMMCSYTCQNIFECTVLHCNVFTDCTIQRQNLRSDFVHRINMDRFFKLSQRCLLQFCIGSEILDRHLTIITIIFSSIVYTVFKIHIVHICIFDPIQHQHM